MTATLIHHGANVNAVEEDSWPLLMIAAQVGHLEIARLLVAEKADVNLEGNASGALWITAQQGHLKVVKMPLNAGALAEGPLHSFLIL